VLGWVGGRAAAGGVDWAVQGEGRAHEARHRIGRDGSGHGRSWRRLLGGEKAAARAAQPMSKKRPRLELKAEGEPARVRVEYSGLPT
jgi:hypothetical protein